MPIRNDHVPWLKRERQALANCAAKGWSAKLTAEHLNDTFHDGQPVRSEPKVTLARQRYKIKVAKVNRDAEAMQATEVVAQTLDVRDDGSVVTATAFGSEVRTIEELIARAKIDLTKYEVDRPETSMYETSVRDAEGTIRKVQNFRIVARFRLKHGPNVKEQVEALIAGAFAKRTPLVGKVPKVSSSDLMQAVIENDSHIGGLAWPQETGREAWDTGIAVDTVREGTLTLMGEGDKRGIAERRFVLLGDFFHHDGKGMTTGGTALDYDSRIQKMLKSGTELLFDLISQSAKSVLTRVYIVPGNHDRVITWALQLLLQTEFKRHSAVVVDESYETTKFMQWGRCLVGMDHGDKGKTRLPAHMATQCEAEWGDSICREILTGHFHSRASIQTVNGITVRTFGTLAPSDLYHAEEKFTSAGPRTMEAITYHKGGISAHNDVWSPDLHRAPRKGTV
jgi:hypothetical protein